MRKYLAAFAWILWASTSYAQVAQSITVKQSTATQIEIMASITTGGLWTCTGSCDQLSFQLVKAADSGIPSTTSWTSTAWGGGTHDSSVTASGNQTWTTELTATDTNTLGRNILCVRLDSQNVKSCVDMLVVASASYAANVSGSLADGTAILTAIGLLDVLPKGVAYANYPVFMRRAGTADDGVTGATVSCQFSKSNGSGYSAFTSTGISGITEVGNGFYSVDFDSTVIGNTTIFKCTSTGGSGASDDYIQFIYGQR